MIIFNRKSITFRRDSKSRDHSCLICISWCLDSLVNDSCFSLFHRKWYDADDFANKKDSSDRHCDYEWNITPNSIVFFSWQLLSLFWCWKLRRQACIAWLITLSNARVSKYNLNANCMQFILSSESHLYAKDTFVTCCLSGLNTHFHQVMKTFVSNWPIHYVNLFRVLPFEVSLMSSYSEDNVVLCESPDYSQMARYSSNGPGSNQYCRHFSFLCLFCLTRFEYNTFFIRKYMQMKLQKESYQSKTA